MNKGRVEDPEDAQLKAMGFGPIQMRARRYVLYKDVLSGYFTEIKTK